MKLKAFHCDDMCIYAAKDINHAVKLYQDDTGEKPDIGYPSELTDEELDAEHDGFDVNERPTGKKTSVREWLKTATAGYLAGSE